MGAMENESVAFALLTIRGLNSGLRQAHPLAAGSSEDQQEGSAKLMT